MKKQDIWSSLTIIGLIILLLTPNIVVGQDSSRVNIQISIFPSFNINGFDKVMGYKYFSQMTRKDIEHESGVTDTITISRTKTFEPITLLMPQKLWNTKWKISYGNSLWRFHISGWNYFGSTEDEDIITTPDEVKNPDGSITYFLNGVYMWNDKGEVVTDMREDSWYAPVYYLVGNSLKLWTMNMYVSRRFLNRLSISIGLTAAHITNRQNLFKEQHEFIFAINTVGGKYNVDNHATVKQSAATISRVIGPSIGFDIYSTYFNASLKTALLSTMKNKKTTHDGKLQNTKKIVFIQPSTGDTTGFILIDNNFPFYKTSRKIIPHAEVDISIGKTYHYTESLSVRYAANLFASAFFHTPIALKWENQNSVNWYAQKRDLIFYGLGVTCEISF